MRVHFTLEPSVKSSDYDHLNWERESICFIKDLDPELIPKEEFSLNNKNYRYYSSIPRIFQSSLGPRQDSYLEVTCYKINKARRF